MICMSVFVLAHVLLCFLLFAQTAVSLVDERRLLAFDVALHQACEGGDRRWYASTLELQLASLGLCKACRGVPTLRVQVGEGTPRTLRFPREPRTTRNSSREPVVQPGFLSWGIDQPIVGVVWPTSLLKLSFGECFNQSIIGVVWPRSQQLSFLGNFNQSIAGIV